MAKRSNDRRRPLDICRINPDRLRALPFGSLQRVWNHLSDRKDDANKRLVRKYVTALLWTKLPANQGTRRQKATFAGVATRTEAKIRQAQARCTRR